MARTAGSWAVAICLAVQASPATATAFPGAEGYGATAESWRGGRVVAVTSLRNEGPGTLRACVEAEGARVCIFKVAGTITLDRPLMIRSDVYVAGQTAPGGGIQLRLGRSATGPLVVKNARDVVIRFLKIRPGTGGGVSANIDAVTVENAQRVYLGNLSMAFASDETFNVHVAGSTVRDITLADSILAYSLDRANHPEGRHSKGALICSDQGTGNQCGRISLLRNLFAHHRDRNPDIKATAIGPVEVINNIFYNPISQFGEFYDLLGDTTVAYAGNLALTGRSTTDRAATAVEGFDWSPEHALAIWAQDNLAFRWTGCTTRRPMPVLDPVAQDHPAPAPVRLTVRPMAAPAVEGTLPARVGDVLPGGGHRDSLDRRVLSDLANCQGHVIDAPAQIGGWPPIPAAAAPPDRDRDHFPDAWEAARPGMDPARPDDPWKSLNGTTALELWLAELAGDL
ncbi:hypothetical protein [Paracoccus sp. T5]|uniref:hypothetical protein n=1 Tax=Paracoccus sp. T5 TaxID=3402161 RepID=UPI003AE3FF08